MKSNYTRTTQFYETDGMGIIHHANYVLYLEEARGHWLRSLPFYKRGDFLESINFPVLHCEVRYKNPIYFDDEVHIEMEARGAGARLYFDYTLTTKRFDKPVAFGKTEHAIMDMKTRRPVRLPEALRQLFPEKGK